MTTLREPVPDLLRRFVETKHRLLVHSLRIETNDFELMLAIEQPRVLRRIVHLASNYHFTLICDYGTASSDRGVMMVEAGRVCTLTIGMTTIIMVDRDRRQVLSFISGMSPYEYLEIYLPLVLEEALP
jgi:hypothetical protein